MSNYISEHSTDSAQTTHHGEYTTQPSSLVLHPQPSSREAIAQRIAETLHGIAETLHGIAETLHGIAETLHGIAETLHGIAETLHGNTT